MACKVQGMVSSGMLVGRIPWADVEGKCLATLVVGTSRVLDFNYVPCGPNPCNILLRLAAAISVAQLAPAYAHHRHDFRTVPMVP